MLYEYNCPPAKPLLQMGCMSELNNLFSQQLTLFHLHMPEIQTRVRGCVMSTSNTICKDFLAFVKGAY